MTLMLALNRMRLRQITEQWSAARESAIGRGVHFRPPFGYDKPENGQAITRNQHAPLVREAFEMRAAGESWAKIARHLNRRAKPTNAQQWTHGTVTHLIRNRAYLGEARHGEHVKPGAHEAIVTPELWHRANAVSGRAPGRADSDGELLTGIVRCAGCRHTMTPSWTQSGRKVRQSVYRCRRNHGAGKCPAPATIDRARIERFVQEAFLDRYAPGSAIGGGMGSVDIQAAQEALQRAETELSAYAAATSISEIGPEAWKAGLDARREAVETGRRALHDALASGGGLELPSTDPWPTLTTPERRRLLSTGIDAVYVRQSGGRAVPVDDRARILWAGESDDDLPGRHLGRAAPIVSVDW